MHAWTDMIWRLMPNNDNKKIFLWKLWKGNRHTCELNDEFTWLLCGGFGGGSIGLCWDCCDSDLKNISRFVCNWKWTHFYEEKKKKKTEKMIIKNLTNGTKYKYKNIKTVNNNNKTSFSPLLEYNTKLDKHRKNSLHVRKQNKFIERFNLTSPFNVNFFFVLFRRNLIICIYWPQKLPPF